MRPALSHQVTCDGGDDGHCGPTGVVTIANEGHETEDSRGPPAHMQLEGPRPQV